MFCFVLSYTKSAAELTAKLPWSLIFISVKHIFSVKLDIIILYVQDLQMTNSMEKNYWM